jgi:hypothetical protein
VVTAVEEPADEPADELVGVADPQPTAITLNDITRNTLQIMYKLLLFIRASSK